MVVNYHVKNRYPLFRIDELSDQLADAQRFLFIDFVQSDHQIII